MSGKALSIIGTMASTLGTYNPLRYRGYVYDQETDLYYLQSRYYNPAIGRFINADAFASTGDGVMGNNMFAYCGNNPVMYSDPGGHARHHVELIGGSYGLADRINDDPLVTKSNLKDYGYSYYKGARVYSAPLPGDGGAFSYGIIVLDDYLETDGIDIFTEKLNHEYGHYVHMNQIGVIKYTKHVAVPSLISAVIADEHGTGVRQWVGINYYNLPWERIADYLGGVNRDKHTNWGNKLGPLYWLFSASF